MFMALPSPWHRRVRLHPTAGARTRLVSAERSDVSPVEAAVGRWTRRKDRSVDVKEVKHDFWHSKKITESKAREERKVGPKVILHFDATHFRPAQFDRPCRSVNMGPGPHDKELSVQWILSEDDPRIIVAQHDRYRNSTRHSTRLIVKNWVEDLYQYSSPFLSTCRRKKTKTHLGKLLGSWTASMPWPCDATCDAVPTAPLPKTAPAVPQNRRRPTTGAK